MAADGGSATEEELVVFSLSEMLRADGLSLNSTPAELARVARKRELAKDMEGVDSANVIAGGRRRGEGATAPSAPPPPAAKARPAEAKPADSDEL